MSDTRVTKIRVPARFEIDGTGPIILVATFGLGTGPCGREVTALHLDDGVGAIRIVQMHADGSSVEFLYPYFQLTGRIEVTYG